ncbi:DUF2520 domain-containing protein [Sphingobacterium sp. SGG-5]|uniref:Rossmann-like and DUF2520 domain-containing protein n=1 Tax=Sphingobacterium sp. SGG-5 TaxID=2710881 RepID=UPI0013ECF94D|nr:Rossmann-like and DUF2520 domain-containing protein [Sphingobacterium sp. SGG-5]NGM60316.1 DUF2520 domain-containing protein [Sphingobacterium sp. SGG-5]
MTVSFIGSGNVATHLAMFFQTHGHEIKQVYNRTADHGRALADTFSAAYISTLEELDTERIDLLLIAISDDNIPEVIREIPEKTKAIVVHTAGAAPLSLLSRFEHYGVIYPPQSIHKHIPIDLANVPFAVEGSSENVQTTLLSMMQKIAPRSFACTTEQRLALHVSSVFANNFTNALYRMSYDILHDVGLPFELVLPLIRETAEKVQNRLPKQVQTGPAVRNDLKTINTHLQFLSNTEELAKIYQQLTQYINKRRPKT